jgi:hypothetical protein
VVLVEESEGCERILEVCADVVLVAVHVGQPFVRAVPAVVRIVADDALGIRENTTFFRYPNLINLYVTFPQKNTSLFEDLIESEKDLILDP